MDDRALFLQVRSSSSSWDQVQSRLLLQRGRLQSHAQRILVSGFFRNVYILVFCEVFSLPEKAIPFSKSHLTPTHLTQSAFLASLLFSEKSILSLISLGTGRSFFSSFRHPHRRTQRLFFPETIVFLSEGSRRPKT